MADPSSGPARKLALITGATGGIGRATAIAFAAQGFELALHYHSASEDVVRALGAAIADVSGCQAPILFFQADLGSYAGVRGLHAAVVSTLGDVDILFSNAGATLGISGVASLADVPIDTFEATWRVNAGASMLLAQLCLPHMERQRWGRLVFNSSVAAFTGGAVGPHYASSKAALHGFVHWLAPTVAAKGVTVNAVAPAMVRGTAMMGDVQSDAMARRVAERLPVGRLGLPEEIAETVVWMVRTGYLTNKVITVDGGMYPY